MEVKVNLNLEKYKQYSFPELCKLLDKQIPFTDDNIVYGTELLLVIVSRQIKLEIEQGFSLRTSPMMKDLNQKIQGGIIEDCVQSKGLMALIKDLWESKCAVTDGKIDYSIT